MSASPRPCFPSAHVRLLDDGAARCGRSPARTPRPPPRGADSAPRRSRPGLADHLLGKAESGIAGRKDQDLHEQLVGRERVVGAEDEIAACDLPTSTPRNRHNIASIASATAGHSAAGSGERQRPTQRAAIADLEIADMPSRSRTSSGTEDRARPVGAEPSHAIRISRRDSGARPAHQPLHIHKMSSAGPAQRQQRQQALPAGQNLRVQSVPRQQLDCLVKRARPVVLELLAVSCIFR